MTRVVHPGSGSWFFTHPGSRGQNGTGSRIRIRNTAKATGGPLILQLAVNLVNSHTHLVFFVFSPTSDSSSSKPPTPTRPHPHPQQRRERDRGRPRPPSQPPDGRWPLSHLSDGRWPHEGGWPLHHNNRHRENQALASHWSVQISSVRRWLAQNSQSSFHWSHWLIWVIFHSLQAVGQFYWFFCYSHSYLGVDTLAKLVAIVQSRASPGTVESEGRQMKQYWIKHRKKIAQKSPSFRPGQN